MFDGYFIFAGSYALTTIFASAVFSGSMFIAEWRDVKLREVPCKSSFYHTTSIIWPIEISIGHFQGFCDSFTGSGAPIAQRAKRWPTDLAAPGSNLA